jgi:hypothetical protein
MTRTGYTISTALEDGASLVTGLSSLWNLTSHLIGQDRFIQNRIPLQENLGSAIQ